MAPIELCLTQADALAAARLHHRATLSHQRFLAATIVFVIGFDLMISSADDRLLDAGLTALFVLGLASIVILAQQVLVLPLAIRRQFREQTLMRETYAMSWSADGYLVQNATARSKLPWTYFIRWREDRHVLLLYQSSRLYQIIPKRVLPIGGVDDLRDHLTRAKVPKAYYFKARVGG